MVVERRKAPEIASRDDQFRLHREGAVGRSLVNAGSGHGSVYLGVRVRAKANGYQQRECGRAKSHLIETVSAQCASRISANASAIRLSFERVESITKSQSENQEGGCFEEHRPALVLPLV